MKGTSPLREMTLCLGARALGDGVAIMHGNPRED